MTCLSNLSKFPFWAFPSLTRSHDQYHIPGHPYPWFLPNWKCQYAQWVGPSPPQKAFKHLGLRFWPLGGLQKPGVIFIKIGSSSPEIFANLISTTAMLRTAIKVRHQQTEKDHCHACTQSGHNPSKIQEI